MIRYLQDCGGKSYCKDGGSGADDYCGSSSLIKQYVGKARQWSASEDEI